MGNKKPKVRPAGPPPVQKRPKKTARLGVHKDDHPVWRMSLLDVDHDGSWGWARLDGAGLQKMLKFLKSIEQSTWAEVRQMMTGGAQRRGALHKPIPLDHLCGEAQGRLSELELEDYDDLFRFRTGNLERLWGVLEDDVFYPVWWDPDHKVCPSRDE